MILMQGAGVNESEDWLAQGRRNWELVEAKGEVGIPWNNPWRRFAVIAVVGAAILAAGHFWLDNNFVRFIGVVIGLIGGASAVFYFVKGARVGGIAATVSTEGCTIGCGIDRLFIPWSAISTEVEHLPVNDQFMSIPIKSGAAGQILIQRPDGSAAAWDGLPYRRAIIRVEFYAPDEGIRIYAWPNEIMVHFLSFLYPILGHRRRSAGASASASNSPGEPVSPA
jgi:hypothetical protein